MSEFSTEVTQRNQLFIGGAWVDSQSGNQRELIAATTGKAFGSVVEGSTADVDAAVAAARKAFDEGPWPNMSAAERAEVLNKFADALEARGEMIARLTATQNGGTLVSNMTINVPWGVGVVRFYANMMLGMEQETPRDCLNPNGTADATIRRIPIGVVAAIVPFNISFIGAMSKLAPALAAGCSFILKPSPDTPMEAFVIADAAAEAGVPAGVINVITSDLDGSERLVAHEGVDMVAFTGSTPVGKKIAAVCSSQMKPCAMELGGNAASIVFEDMPMEAVIPGLLGTSMLLNNGQACIAQTRILVPQSQYDAYVAALGGAASQIMPGDPMNEETFLGPMVSESHMQRVLDYVKIGVEEGARLVAGGERETNLPEEIQGGFYVQPTVFADVTNDMRICQEEIFGPVIKVMSYETEEEAIAIANDQPFGLSSSVWSVDPERAMRVARQLIAGSVYINGAMTIDVNVPFAGLKESGLGAECGPEGIDEFFQKQVLFTPKAS